MKNSIVTALGLSLCLYMASCGKPQNSPTDYISEDERHFHEVTIDGREIPDNSLYSDTMPNTDFGNQADVNVSDINVDININIPKIGSLPDQLVKTGEKIQEETPTVSAEISPEAGENSLSNPVEGMLEGAMGGIDDSSELDKLLHQYEDRKEGTKFCDAEPSLKEFIEYGHMIQQLSGAVKDPNEYANDLIGFQKFLSDSQVKHFSAYEMTKPGNYNYAKQCNISAMIPPKGCWLRSAAIALFSDKIRGDLKKPVLMTSHFRPDCYNKLVKGAKFSDHIQSRSSDLAFRTVNNRFEAQKFICKTFWKDDLFGLQNVNDPHGDGLNISVGLGNTFMHVGLGSVQGRRYWLYKSYVENNQMPEECWVSQIVK